MSLSSTTRRPRWVALAGGVVATGLLAVACGGSDDPSNAAQEGSAGTAAAAGATSVEIDTFQFSPKLSKVKVGDTVTWTNQDAILHTVTSGTREYQPGDSGSVTATNKDGLFDIQLDGKGATGTHTFTSAGTFHYFCDRHPGMEADIEVS